MHPLSNCLLLFLFFGLTISHIISLRKDLGTCDKRKTVCKKLKQCLNYQSKIDTDFNKTASREKLNELHCGFKGSKPKVCCPNAFPNVENHPNLRFLSTQCGRFSDDRIFRGVKVKLNEFPWMAVLISKEVVVYKNESHITYKESCGGIIINSRYILTANHCVTEELYGVRVGENDLNAEYDCDGEFCMPHVQDFLIEKSISPSSQKNGSINDIALLRLNANIDMHNGLLEPICLPINRLLQDSSLKVKNMTACGWGVTEKNERSTDLVKADIPMISNKRCSKKLKKHIFPGMLCTWNMRGNETCTGDSGGPLMSLHLTKDDQGNYGYRYVAQGIIVGRGPSICGSIDQPYIHTRVAYYMDWILNSLEEF